MPPLSCLGEAWSQLTFTQLHLCILQKCAGVGWLFLTSPLLDEFKPILKLFKTLFYLSCVCACVYIGGGNGRAVVSSNHPFFLPFVSCLLLQGEELFIELLDQPELVFMGVWLVSCLSCLLISKPDITSPEQTAAVPSKNPTGFSQNTVRAVPCKVAGVAFCRSGKGSSLSKT